MPLLNLTNEQVYELVSQLSPEIKRNLLMKIAEEISVKRIERMNYAEAQLRELCNKRGKNWDIMSEKEREEFIDDIIHEDRQCSM